MSSRGKPGPRPTSQGKRQAQAPKEQTGTSTSPVAVRRRKIASNVEGGDTPVPAAATDSRSILLQVISPINTYPLYAFLPQITDTVADTHVKVVLLLSLLSILKSSCYSLPQLVKTTIDFVMFDILLPIQNCTKLYSVQPDNCLAGEVFYSGQVTSGDVPVACLHVNGLSKPSQDPMIWLKTTSHINTGGAEQLKKVLNTIVKLLLFSYPSDRSLPRVHFSTANKNFFQIEGHTEGSGPICIKLDSSCATHQDLFDLLWAGSASGDREQFILSLPPYVDDDTGIPPELATCQRAALRRHIREKWMKGSQRSLEFFLPALDDEEQEQDEPPQQDFSEIELNTAYISINRLIEATGGQESLLTGSDSAATQAILAAISVAMVGHNNATSEAMTEDGASTTTSAVANAFNFCTIFKPTSKSGTVKVRTQHMEDIHELQTVGQILLLLAGETYIITISHEDGGHSLHSLPPLIREQLRARQELLFTGNGLMCQVPRPMPHELPFRLVHADLECIKKYGSAPCLVHGEDNSLLNEVHNTFEKHPHNKDAEARQQQLPWITPALPKISWKNGKGEEMLLEEGTISFSPGSTGSKGVLPYHVQDVHANATDQIIVTLPSRKLAMRALVSTRGTGQDACLPPFVKACLPEPAERDPYVKAFKNLRIRKGALPSGFLSPLTRGNGKGRRQVARPGEPKNLPPLWPNSPRKKACGVLQGVRGPGGKGHHLAHYQACPFPRSFGIISNPYRTG